MRTILGTKRPRWNIEEKSEIQSNLLDLVLGIGRILVGLWFSTDLPGGLSMSVSSPARVSVPVPLSITGASSDKRLPVLVGEGRRPATTGPRGT
ncbi:MAG: hypothetical protein OEM84_01825 [Acidimicrobiia bacterium]|nr:hypothetical protein [Acidimicrobiia bacterium]